MDFLGCSVHVAFLSSDKFLKKKLIMLDDEAQLRDITFLTTVVPAQ